MSVYPKLGRTLTYWQMNVGTWMIAEGYSQIWQKVGEAALETMFEKQNSRPKNKDKLRKLVIA